MARFIKDEDYGMQIKTEIRGILVSGYDDPKLIQAEITAIDQMTNYLCGRYDVYKIFHSEEPRDHFIVMTVIDLTLYHLYSSRAANQLPDHRSQRYEDALTWLKGASRGTMSANLPMLEDAPSCDIRIISHTPLNHKW